MVRVITKPRPSARKVATASFHALRRRRLQPGAESQHAVGQRTRNNDGGVAENFRSVVGSCPGHQHLRIGQQQLLEAIDFGLQRHGVVSVTRARAGWLRGACGSGRLSPARAKQANPASNVKGGDFLPVERCRRRDQAPPSRPRPGCADMTQIFSEDGCGEESAPPRTRTQPLVRRPDRLRHFRIAPRDAQRSEAVSATPFDRSFDFTPQGTRADRVHMVNVLRRAWKFESSQRGNADRRLSASLGPASHVFNVDRGQARSKSCARLPPARGVPRR